MEIVKQESLPKILVTIKSLKEDYSIKKELDYEEYWRLRSGSNRFGGIKIIEVKRR